MEAKKPVVFAGGPSKKRCVHFYLQSNHCSLAGDWHWELSSDLLFCSDRFMTLPAESSGGEITNSILHPDDALYVQEVLMEASEGTTISLSFRIITSYGQMKKVSVQNTSLYQQYPEDVISSLFGWELEKYTTSWALKLQAKECKLRQSLSAWAEAVRREGVWYYNKSTHQTWYSEGVYRLYGVQPESLNAHLNTFRSFIHPEDLAVYSDAFYKTLNQEQPLHISFRIRTLQGSTYTVQQVTHWTFTEAGERLLMGWISDITPAEKKEAANEQVAFDLLANQGVVQLHEEMCETAGWSMNATTRKVVLSTNIHRVFRTRQHTFSNGLHDLLPLVHAKDKATVEKAFDELWQRHLPVNLTFHIVCPGDECRLIEVRSKVVKNKSGEETIAGLFMDRTIQVQQHNKLNLLRDMVQSLDTARTDAYPANKRYLLTLELYDGQVLLSPSFNALMGDEGASRFLSLPEFKRHVRLDDLDAFNHLLNISQHETQVLSPVKINLVLGREVRLFSVRAESFNEEKTIGVFSFVEAAPSFAVSRSLTDKLQLSSEIVDNSPDIIIVTDFYNNIVLCNRAYEEQFRQKRGKIIGKNYFDVLPQEDAVCTRQHFEAIFRGETVDLLEQREQNEMSCFNINLFPIKGDDGKVTGILHHWRNVANEFKLQKRLTLRLNFIENILEAVVDRISVLDKHMNYLYWNHPCEVYHQLKKDDVIGRNILEIFPQLINYPTYNSFQQALSGKVVHLPANESKTPPHYFETFLIPIFEHDGGVNAVLWVEHDLTNEYEVLKYQRKADEILNSINEAYMEVDGNSVVQYINRSAEKLWSITKEDVFGKPIPRANAAWLGAEGHSAIDKALNESKEVQLDYFSPAKRWLYLSAKPSTEGAIVLSYDIQDIKEARDNLQEEHRRLKEAQALGHIGSFERNYPEGKVHWSDELYRIYGLEPQSEAITPARFLSFVHPDDLPVLQKEIRRTREGKVPLDIVHRIVRHDGAIRHVHGRVQGSYNQKGELNKIYGTIQDVTERKNTEEELLRISQLLEAAFNTSPFGLTLMQAIRDEKGQIQDLEYLLCNHMARKMAGKDLTGLRCLKYFPTVKAIGLYDQLLDTIEKGVGIDWEHYYEGEGMQTWFHWRAQKLGDAVFVVVEDISERKQAETQLKVTNDLLHNIVNSPSIGINVFKTVRSEAGAVVDFEFVLVNEKGANYHNRHDLVGKCLFTEFPLLKEQLPMLMNVLETGAIFRDKFYFPANKHWIGVSYARLNDGILCLWEDLTKL